MALGEHTRVWNPNRLVWHHGIDLGDGQVVHFMSPNGSKTLARVRLTSFAAFSVMGRVEVVPREHGAFPPDEVARRALSLLGYGDYNVLSWNCEHVANWCVYGRKRSWQARHLLFRFLGPATLPLMNPAQRRRHLRNLQLIDRGLSQRSGLRWVPSIEDVPSRPGRRSSKLRT
jgi:lecithin:retinol acyltransferase